MIDGVIIEATTSVTGAETEKKAKKRNVVRRRLQSSTDVINLEINRLTVRIFSVGIVHENMYFTNFKNIYRDRVSRKVKAIGRVRLSVCPSVCFLSFEPTDL